MFSVKRFFQGDIINLYKMFLGMFSVNTFLQGDMINLYKMFLGDMLEFFELYDNHRTRVHSKKIKEENKQFRLNVHKVFLSQKVVNYWNIWYIYYMVPLVSYLALF